MIGNSYYRNRKTKLAQKEYSQILEVKSRKNEQVRNRIKNDEGYAIMRRLRCLFNNALRDYTKTGKIWSASKYGIDYQAIVEHLKPFPTNRSKYHVDHIKPLVSFDLTNPEEVKIAFAPENHQWLLASENISKGSKII